MKETWTTKTGQKILISKMTDSHLMNTIRLVARSYAKAIGFYLLSPGPQGEMAQEAFDREFDDLDEGGPSVYNDKYDALTEEADNRGLDDPDSRQKRMLLLDLAVMEVATRK